MESVGELGRFGDARRAAMGTRVLERVMETGSLVIKTLGEDRAGEMTIHRFLSTPAVNRQEMIETVSARAAEACTHRRIVAVQDTTEINFSGREANRRGLGPAGDGISAGFFIHPVIAVDSETEAVLGVIDINIWTRSDEYIDNVAHRGFEDKESIRWLNGAEHAAKRLAGYADSIVVVGDRESDIYSVFARRPPTVDLIIRAAQNRKIVSNEGFGDLFGQAANWPELGRADVKVSARPGVPARTARVALRAGMVTVKRPRNGYDPADPPVIALTLVEVREIGTPGRGEPLLWRLVTTLATPTVEAAMEVVRLYRLRWRIEEVFRALKSDGMELEDTQLHEAQRIFKLATIGLIAATRTIQLVDARDGSPRPATDVLAPEDLAAAEVIGRSLEGKTDRQKNPHPRHSLAWLSWIVARLGGWNCYYKPPGPKTIHAGWKRFAMIILGCSIAKQNV